MEFGIMISCGNLKKLSVGQRSWCEYVCLGMTVLEPGQDFGVKDMIPQPITLYSEARQRRVSNYAAAVRAMLMTRPQLQDTWRNMS